MGRTGDNSLASLFFAGEHRAVTELTIDSPSSSYPTEDFPFVVGALVMLGRIEEAETAFLLRKNQLTQAQRVACHYFLGIGFCRHSFYEKSRRYFVESVKIRHSARDPVSRFYRHMGIGFYHYFAGRIKRALKSGDKSLKAALEAQFLYGRALASDLKGHSLVQTGEVGRGLKTLELAEHLASQLGAAWLCEAIQASLLSYRARYGIIGEQAVPQLLKKLNRLSKQDIYTQSTLLLQLSQEYLQRGQVTKAKESLNECCQIVYGSQNRRHAALLNLRYAYVHFLEGEAHLALNLIRNSLTQINSEVDVLLELRLRGFERKLVKHLRLEVCEKSLAVIVTKLTQRVGEAVALRILAREQTPDLSPVRRGEDPVGDLWDRIGRGSEDAVEAILRSGYSGLLSEVLPVERGSRTLYLELEPDSLTVFEKGNVLHFPEVLSRSLRKILMEIQRGPRTKEELIENIWKYKYHPLRHDAFIYSAIAKLRKVLGKRSHWIEASEAGYHLRRDVEVVIHAETPRSYLPKPTQSVSLPVELQGEWIALNHRQQKILRLLDQREFIDTATCRSLFDTSEITASRDLSELLRLCLVERQGRGRATRYVSKSNSISVQSTQS